MYGGPLPFLRCHVVGVGHEWSLDEHIALLNKTITETVPVDFEGAIGFDYEGFEGVWDTYSPGFCYKNASIRLTQAAHPTWPAARVEAQARVEFESAARSFYLATIRTAKNMRPKAKWVRC